MKLSRRQWTETEKRNDKILYLLEKNFNINNIKISLLNKNITIENDSIVLGCFNNYNNLKKLQLNLINKLNEIVIIIDSKHFLNKLNEIKRG